MPRKGPEPSELTFHCVSPANEPGKHGSNPQSSLQGTPFHTESSNIWVGYRDSPGKKYLGMFPSFQEMVGLCRANAISKTNNAFPRFLTHSSDNDKWQKDEFGNLIRKACCTACSKENGACEALTLEFIPVTIPPRKVVKAYLLAYNFYLKGGKMVALVWHSGQGIHFFQKTDGSLSRSLSLHSNHICTTRPVPLPSRGESIQRDSSDPRIPDGEFDRSYPNDSADDSSLTDFDSVKPEEVTKSPVTPRTSLRSSQSSLPQGSAIRVAVSSLPVQLPTQIPQSRKRGCVVIDLTEGDESPRIKKERSVSPELLAHTVPYITPPTTHPSAPSTSPSEDRSTMTGSARESLANEYGRMSAQIAQERSMRVFELPKMIDFKRRMIQAVRTGDGSALYRIYGEVQVFFATMD